MERLENIGPNQLKWLSSEHNGGILSAHFRHDSCAGMDPTTQAIVAAMCHRPFHGETKRLGCRTIGPSNEKQNRYGNGQCPFRCCETDVANAHEMTPYPMSILDLIDYQGTDLVQSAQAAKFTTFAAIPAIR